MDSSSRDRSVCPGAGIQASFQGRERNQADDEGPPKPTHARCGAGNGQNGPESDQGICQLQGIGPKSQRVQQKLIIQNHQAFKEIPAIEPDKDRLGFSCMRSGRVLRELSSG